MAMFVPQGLGIGINCETFGDQRSKWQQAVDVLRPAWSHSWVGSWGTANSGMPLPIGPNHVPMLDPAYFGVMPAAKLAVWRDQMIARSLQWDELTWQMCNEPEGSGKTVRELTELIARQAVEFAVADIRWRMIFPNGNVNTDANYRYTIDAFERVRQGSILVQMGVHLWYEAQHHAAIWGRLKERYGRFRDGVLDPIVVTEAGPGPFCSTEQWLAMLPLVYDLLDDPDVGAVAPFAAYPKFRADVERHPGLMLPDGSLTALGAQYVQEQQRRSNQRKD